MGTSTLQRPVEGDDQGKLGRKLHRKHLGSAQKRSLLDLEVSCLSPYTALMSCVEWKR